jgi:hypothetical protein
MRRRWFQFGLGTMFVVVTCFGAAAALVGYCMNAPVSREEANDAGLMGVDNVVAMRLTFAALAIGPMLGFGIGNILDRRLRSTAIGFICGLAVFFGAVARWAFNS